MRASERLERTEARLAAREPEPIYDGLSVSEWRFATHAALAVLRDAKTRRLVELHARSWSEAHRLAAVDEGCRAIERAKTWLEDQADGLSYIPGYVHVREILEDIAG